MQRSFIMLLSMGCLAGLVLFIFVVIGFADLFPQRNKYPAIFLDTSTLSLHSLRFWDSRPSRNIIQAQQCSAKIRLLLDQKYSNLNLTSQESQCKEYKLNETQSVVDVTPQYSSTQITAKLDKNWNFLTHPENCYASAIALYIQDGELHEIVRSYDCYPGWYYSNFVVTNDKRIYFDYGGHGYTWQWIPGRISFYVQID